MSLLRLSSLAAHRMSTGFPRVQRTLFAHMSSVRANLRARIIPTSSIATLRRYYHDDGVYGYRRPRVFTMPDCMLQGNVMRLSTDH
jgi:hypothetical protein